MKEILKKTYLLFLLLPLLAIYITGCGEANPAAPSGAVIEIKPEKVDFTYSGFPETWYSYFFTIVVYEDSTKTKTMSDVEITITYPMANPYPRYAVQFYHNGERVNSPLTVKTDKYGTYILRFDYCLGCWLAEYKGDIEVRSGAALDSATFEVKVE